MRWNESGCDPPAFCPPLPSESGSTPAGREFNLAAPDQVERTEITNGNAMASEQNSDPNSQPSDSAASGGADREGLAASSASASTIGSASASTPAARNVPESLSTDREMLEFDLAVEVLYYKSRGAWFASLHRWAMLGAIVFGSAAAAQVVNVKLCGMLAVLSAAIDLAFNIPERRPKTLR